MTTAVDAGSSRETIATWYREMPTFVGGEGRLSGRPGTHNDFIEVVAPGRFGRDDTELGGFRRPSGSKHAATTAHLNRCVHARQLEACPAGPT